MYSLETQIEVDASPTRVWQLLVDFPAHAGWNPFIRAIEGDLQVGKFLDVQLQPQGGRAMRFRPEVLVVTPGRELRWKGKLFVRGLFDGEHYFMIEDRPRGGSVFRQGELFSGLLLPLFRRSLDGPVRASFAAMNEALRREAEKP